MKYVGANMASKDNVFLVIFTSIQHLKVHGAPVCGFAN
jgi:hypothetical protein